MDFNNNKGISVVALLVTVIVMLIIASITIYGGSKAVKEAKMEDVKTNMLLIQAKVKSYVEQAKFEKKDTINGITIDDVTIYVKQSSEAEGFYEMVETDGGDTPMDLSKWNLSDIDASKYLVFFDINNLEVDIYFIPGIADSDGSIYKNYQTCLKTKLV